MSALARKRGDGGNVVSLPTSAAYRHINRRMDPALEATGERLGILRESYVLHPYREQYDALKDLDVRLAEAWLSALIAVRLADEGGADDRP